VITAGLAKIDRVGEVDLLRPDDLAETVFFFMGFEISPGKLRLPGGSQPESRNDRQKFSPRIRPAFMDYQAPVGVRMFQRYFSIVRSRQ
jgi:hypothetical protein